MSSSKLPTYFLSHGGGPWPWMKESTGKMYEKLEQSLKEIRRELNDAPRAVLMVSGHWEANQFLLSAAAQPGMEYDYYGFPEHTYRIKYAAPGAPMLANKVKEMLEAKGLPSGIDNERGFDHGTFTLMHELYPEAKIPVVQLSLRSNYAPDEHIRVGEVLAPLRDEGVLIIGSGLSYHDLRGLMTGRGKEASALFDQWLNQTVVESSPEQRHQRLVNWSDAPSARAAHPREDHLIPLMVAAGAAKDEKAERIYFENDFMGAITVSSYRFGALPV